MATIGQAKRSITSKQPVLDKKLHTYVYLEDFAISLGFSSNNEDYKSYLWDLGITSCKRKHSANNL